jgi:Tfp pilus assembly protein PilF
MKHRIHILSLTLLGFVLLPTHPCAGQDNPDDKPHIQPRATATPTPTPKATPSQRSPDQYERPPFPGDAPGTRPTSKPPADGSKSPDGYEKPPFPGDAPGSNPTTGSSAPGESSSRDSQIDLNAKPENAQPEPVETDERELTPWDPHKAAKDVEVGEWYLKIKNYRAALERFNHALQYKPNDAEAIYGLAVTQEKLELLSLASQNYRKYLEILPNGPKAKEATEGIARLGSQAATVKPAGASPDAVKASAHDINVGETYLSGNNFDAARERFEEALRLTPDNPVACFRMAQSLQGMQRLDPARMYYRKYLELEPKGKFAGSAKKAIADIDWILGK